MRLPQSFKNAVTAAAKTLNHSIKQIGALHEGEHFVPSERNAVLHLGASLLHAGFALYTEPFVSAKTILPALVATNQKITFVVGALALGKLQPSKILQQAEALENYTPHAYPRLDQPEAAAFWHKTERWAVVLLQSLAGEAFNELWCAQLAAPVTFEKSLRAFDQLTNGGKEYMSELANFLRTQGAHVGMEPLCKSLWHNGERLDLLWAAFPLRVE